MTVVDDKINSDRYLELIQQVIEPELQASDRNLVFMQDNAPAHKAKRVMDYFAQKGIQVLDWPPQSPHLNPIELVWGFIKQKLYSEKDFPKNKQELVDRVFDIWNSITEDTFERLCNEVIYRLRGVVAAEGGWFKK